MSHPIRRLALRLNEIGSAIRSATLMTVVRDRSAELRKPDHTLDRALDDLRQASGALEGVKVYATTYPLDWHEQKLWDTSEDFRRHVRDNLAANVARGLRDIIQLDLIDTDSPQVKAVMGQVMLVTAEPQAFTDDIEAAFQAGAEAMRRSIAAKIDAEFRGEDQRAALAYALSVVRAHRVEAPEHMKR